VILEKLESGSKSHETGEVDEQSVKMMQQHASQREKEEAKELHLGLHASAGHWTSTEFDCRGGSISSSLALQRCLYQTT
jgi:hypothetical protein